MLMTDNRLIHIEFNVCLCAFHCSKIVDTVSLLMADIDNSCPVPKQYLMLTLSRSVSISLREIKRSKVTCQGESFGQIL